MTAGREEEFWIPPQGQARRSPTWETDMDDGTYYTMAFREYAFAHGAMDPEAPWILTPMDTWERNPHYRGPPARHPEDDRD